MIRGSQKQVRNLIGRAYVELAQRERNLYRSLKRSVQHPSRVKAEAKDLCEACKLFVKAKVQADEIEREIKRRRAAGQWLDEPQPV